MNVVRRALLVLLTAVLSLPAAFIITFMLLPVWSRIESTWGIESVGHSGPADWCFYAVYAVVITIALWFVVMSSRRGRSPSRPSP